MVKPYMAPSIWMIIGFLAGWQHFAPGIISGSVYFVALMAMTIWITNDIGRDINPE